MKVLLTCLALTLAGSLRGETGNDLVLALRPTKEVPRNSEGAFVSLGQGGILFCYSQFYGGNRDHNSARIAAIESHDDGRTWSSPRTLIDGPTGEGRNVMSVSLLRLAKGKLLLFYLFKESAEDCRPFLCVSTDNGKTWSAPRGLIARPGYYILNNDRIVQLSTGRLIMPMNQHARTFARGEAVWFFSDDEGATWQRSASRWGVPDGKSGLQESGVVELADGSLLTWCRTDLGSQYVCRSKDGGETWSAPHASQLVSPLSPASIKRLPRSANLLAVFNDQSGQFPFVAGQRTPLVAAISTDGGETWPQRKLIESDIKRWYHYAAIHFTEGAVLVAYNTGDDQMAKLGGPLTIRRISSSWLPNPK